MVLQLQVARMVCDSIGPGNMVEENVQRVGCLNAICILGDQQNTESQFFQWDSQRVLGHSQGDLMEGLVEFHQRGAINKSKNDTFIAHIPLKGQVTMRTFGPQA